MAKLRSVLIKDFQAHALLRVDFSPQITTIRGASDVGKSAVLRAIRWVCLNDFAGDAYIREGANSAEVELLLHMQGQSVIVRRKRGKENLYELQIGDEETKAFRAVGSTVPDEIKAVLQLNEINFQFQHDMPFWFAESGVEVSRKLNSVIDLSIIDTALTNIFGEVYKARTKKNLCEERETDLRGQWDAIKDSQQRVDEFRELQLTKTKLTAAQETYRTLKTILVRIKDINVKSLVEQHRDLGQKLELMKAVRIQRKSRLALVELVREIEYQKQNFKCPPNLKPVEEAFDRWRTANQSATDLRSLINKIENEAEVKLRYTNEQLKAKTMKYDEETKKKKVCPTCRRPL